MALKSLTRCTRISLVHPKVKLNNIDMEGVGWSKRYKI